MSAPEHRTHDRALAAAATALDFALAPVEAAELAAHLAACASCARTAAALHRDDAALLRPAEVRTSARLDAAVVAAIAGRPARPWASRTFVLVAAAVLLLVALLGAAAVGAFLERTRLPLVVVPPPSAPVVDVAPSTGPSATPAPNTTPAPVLAVGMSAEAVVAASQAAHRDPPPFTLTTTFGPPETFSTAWYTACGDLARAEDRAQIRWRYLFDGTSFRQECRYSDGRYLGGFELLTPEGHGVWDGTEWKVVGDGFLGRPAGAPLATALWLNWVNVGAATDPAAGRPVTCDAWTLGPVEQVATRPAQVVSCGADRFWIDWASGLLVRRERAGLVLAEAVDLQVGTAGDPALFAMLDPGFSTELTPGRRPVPIQLPCIGGGTWSSESLLGRRPAAILVQSDCHAAGECLPLDDFVAAVAARSGRMGAAAIALYGAFGGPSIEAAEAAGVPVLLDDLSGWPRWDQRTGVALFGADGRLTALVDPKTPASLAAVLDAFLAGREIPVPPPWDAHFIIAKDVPPLRGLPFRNGTLSMDSFDLAALRGRPVAVLAAPRLDTGGEGSCASRPSITAAVAGLASARRALGDRVAFVVVSRDDPIAQAAQTWDTILATAGTTDRDLTVVVPSESTAQPWSTLWSGSDQATCGFGPVVVVVDADGRVARVFGDVLPTAAELEEVLRGLLP